MRLLHKLFNETESEAFPEAKVTLIPKPEKDPNKSDNYRQICLMNIDTKTLSKILANRMHQFINQIIHCMQVEFIPGYRDDAICKSH